MVTDVPPSHPAPAFPLPSFTPSVSVMNMFPEGGAAAVAAAAFHFNVIIKFICISNSSPSPSLKKKKKKKLNCITVN